MLLLWTHAHTHLHVLKVSELITKLIIIYTSLNLLKLKHTLMCAICVYCSSKHVTFILSSHWLYNLLFEWSFSIKTKSPLSADMWLMHANHQYKANWYPFYPIHSKQIRYKESANEHKIKVFIFIFTTKSNTFLYKFFEASPTFISHYNPFLLQFLLKKWKK